MRKRAPRTSSRRSRPAQTTSWAHSWAPSWAPYLQQPLHVHGQLGSDTPQHRRAARIFEWGGFVPIWSDLLRGSARRRSFYLSSWGCSSVSPAFGVWLPTSRVWMEKMTHRRPERTRGARGTRAHPQLRVRDVGQLPVRLPDRLPVEVLRALLCVATGAGAAFESDRKIEKSFSNSFLVFWVWADTPIHSSSRSLLVHVDPRTP